VTGRRPTGPHRITVARRAGSLVTGLLIGSAVASLTGCVGDAERPVLPSAGSGSTAAAPRTGTPAAGTGVGGGGTRPPRTAAWVPVTVPATAPVPLPDPPAGAAGWVARFWFRGVPVDRDGDRLVVAYAVVDLHAAGSAVVGHVRLAVFRCLRRNGANFSGCTDRRAEYGDLGAPGLAVHRVGADGLVLTGRFPTYRYAGAVDRGPGLPAGWTGRSWPIRITCSYDPDSDRPLTAGARIDVGEDGLGGAATLDRGYPNRVTA
jgi:hypothetical protein